MLTKPLLDALITQALQEDLAGGDITTQSTVAQGKWARAQIIAKEDLVLSGTEVFARVFSLLSPGTRVEQLATDGAQVRRGDVVLEVESTAHCLLGGERTALNFLQHLSGVATLTRSYVERAQGKARICDTRKTTPGLRALERKAVRDGGGHNHRDCLGSAVLIKENHIRAAGGILAALEGARASAPHTSRLEIEVTNLGELSEALSGRADIIMLDNFKDADIQSAVEQVAGRAVLEVSGGITLERVGTLIQLGIQVISVGALTHSAPAADLSMLLELSP